jgi:O-methyltransferase
MPLTLELNKTMSFKKQIKKVLELILSALGIEAHLGIKRAYIDTVAFDRNILSYFYTKHHRLDLYYEGLKKTKLEWTDNFSKQCRFNSLHQLVEHVAQNGHEGDFAECGCWKGHTAFITSSILKKHNFKHKFHIFDSFKGGLSDKSEEDSNQRLQQSQMEIKKEKEVFASTEEEVAHLLAEYDFVNLYKGWIPDRFKDVEDRTFAYAHIDVDLYKPTLDSLHFFYSRLVDGGVIVIDDYGFTQFPGCAKAVDEFLKSTKPSFFHEMPLGGAFLIK